jgi:glycosyltransferase involved in cell wall biosynthesis
MQPAVSVIIPTFNRASLVRQAIVSLRDSGVSGIEIVIADDGSTDETEAVARSFPGVIYAPQANAGPAAARNTGFAASCGRYVCFLDSDDEWIPGAPQRIVDQLDANADLAAIFADTSMGNSTTGFKSFVDTYGGERFARLQHATRPCGARVFDRSPFFRLLSTRNVMFLGSLLVRRETFAAMGGFDPKLRGAADWEFFMRLTLDHPIAFSEGAATSIYLKHDEGMSTDVDHMEKDFILALEGVLRKCDLIDGDRRHVKEQLRRHLRGWVYLAYEARDFPAMRERLHWTFSLGHGRAREVAFLVASYLHPTVVGFLRATRHALTPR